MASQQYLDNLYPLEPAYYLRDDGAFDDRMVPYKGSDNRALLHCGHAHEDAWYTSLDLNEDLYGCQLAVEGDWRKKLEASKEFLDEVSRQVKDGTMTRGSLEDTQQQLHLDLTKDHNHNRGYMFVDVSNLPAKFLTDRNGLLRNFQFLRDMKSRHRVWYVSYQAQQNRIVIMGNNPHNVHNCFNQITDEIYGRWHNMHNHQSRRPNNRRHR